jgi:hypothetical protein
MHIMNISVYLANHFKESYFGKNWSWSFLKQHLDDVNWEEAVVKIDGLHSIAELTYHLHYFIQKIKAVLEGDALTWKDEESFDCPEIVDATDWTTFLDSVYEEAAQYEALVAALSEAQLLRTFSDEKYGNYFRNIQGATEHVYYHLGQIVMLKKLIRSKSF